MIRTIIFTSCMAFVFLMSGCAPSKEARIDQLTSDYPQWEQSTIELVADHQIKAGMTEEMALAAMGKPWGISHDGETTVWEYGYFDHDSEGYTIQKLSYFIYFLDKKVIRTAGDKSRLGFRYR